MKSVAVILVVLVAFALPVSASAKGAEEYVSDFSSLIPEDMSDKLSDAESLTDAVGFEAVISEIFEVLSNNGGALSAFLLMLIGLSLLTALSGTLEGALAGSVRSAVSAISATAIFGSIFSLVKTASSALAQMSAFFNKLIPIFAGVTLAGGGVSSAGVGATGMTLTLGVIGGLSGEILASVVSLMFALGLVADLGSTSSAGLLKSAKGFFTWGIGILTFLLGATLALQTVIASASDSMLMRSAKFTASGMIPIVGGSVSGALSTLASGLSYAKGFIGIGAVFVIVTIALSPIILMLAYRSVLSLSVDFLSFLDTGGGVRCFSSMLGALDSLIAVFSMSTLVYILEVILFIKSGVALI